MIFFGRLVIKWIASLASGCVSYLHFGIHLQNPGLAQSLEQWMLWTNVFEYMKWCFASHPLLYTSPPLVQGQRIRDCTASLRMTWWPRLHTMWLKHSSVPSPTTGKPSSGSSHKRILNGGYLYWILRIPKKGVWIFLSFDHLNESGFANPLRKR